MGECQPQQRGTNDDLPNKKTFEYNCTQNG